MHGSGKPYGVIKDYSKTEISKNQELLKALLSRTDQSNTNQFMPAKNSNTDLHILIEPEHSRHGSQFLTSRKNSDNSLADQGALSLRANSYLNTKNISVIQTNYSYRAQLAKQIEKVRKYQPDVSLSKLIDLNEY